MKPVILWWPPMQCQAKRLAARYEPAQRYQGIGGTYVQWCLLAEVSRLGWVGGRNALKILRRHAEGRHYRGSVAAAWFEVILGGRLVGQFDLEPVTEQGQIGLRLGVSGQLQFAAVGSGDENVDHLNGCEFLEHAARGQARREPFQAAAEGDVQTIGEEGDEDVRLGGPGGRSALSIAPKRSPPLPTTLARA